MMSPRPGDSTLMTSAPWSASIIAASGPEIITDRSTTLMPSSGPVFPIAACLHLCGCQHADVLSESIPLTVVGGYLGAGKTTLLNHLLRHPGGRRLGVIVNDFGSLAVDAALLADAADRAAGAGVISLPNGCVCCTVGAGLHEALDALATSTSPPDHIVIEVSGVADPSVARLHGAPCRRSSRPA